MSRKWKKVTASGSVRELNANLEEADANAFKNRCAAAMPRAVSKGKGKESDVDLSGGSSVDVSSTSEVGPPSPGVVETNADRVPRAPTLPPRNPDRLARASTQQSSDDDGEEPSRTSNVGHAPRPEHPSDGNGERLSREKNVAQLQRSDSQPDNNPGHAALGILNHYIPQTDVKDQATAPRQ
jgi:hypothetical protein